MTNILYSENLQSKVERYKQRLSQALRTAENRFYNGLEQQKAGGIWDEDTKLIRFGVRDYDPETGRWTSVEPLGFAGSRNWYVYAGNDGVNFVDLDGNWYFPVVVIGIDFNYYTTREAAIEAIAKVLFCKTKKNNKEYCAFQYKDKNSGLYLNSPVTEGSSGGCNPYGFLRNIPKGVFTSKDYEIGGDIHSHTHSNDKSDEFASTKDSNDGHNDYDNWINNYKFFGKNYRGSFISSSGWLIIFNPNGKSSKEIWSMEKLKCPCDN